MVNLPKLIERFIRVTERFLSREHLCRVTEGVIVLSHKLANERRDCPPDNSQEYKDLAKYQRKTLSSRKAFDKIGRVLTAELERYNENSTDLFRLLNTFNAGGGGAAVANPLWQSLKPCLQRIAIRAAIPTSKPKQSEENVSERLPRTDAEADILKPAIAGLLRMIPETWAEFEPDKLTAIQSNALFLLEATGLVERRRRIRVRMLNHPTMFEATYTATGEQGAVDALTPLIAVLWGEWQNAYQAWKDGDRADVAPEFWEDGKPDEWRLTDQGILARGDFDGTKPNADPDDACNFIFKRGVYGPGYWIWKATFWGLTEDDKQTIQNHRNAGHDITRLPRPSVVGSGRLVEYHKLDKPTGSQAVNLTNWQDGADAFAAAFAAKLGPAFEAMSKGQPSNGLPPAPTAPPQAAKQEQGEGNGGADVSPEHLSILSTVEKKAILDKMEPADRKAYFAFQYAATKLGRMPEVLEDREAYEWLKENGIDQGKGDLGELADYKLPSLATWSKQVRNARKPLREQKYTRRAGRPTGSSIVKDNEIENQRGDDD